MRTVAIVQARFGSSRLPGKIFLDLGGKPALLRCLARASRIAGVDEVMVATTTAPLDETVERLARRAGYRTFRGDEDDVLARYAAAARESKADVVVRLTSDCPLLDPVESARVVAAIGGAEPIDYAANVLERRLPRGLDTEAISAEVLQVAAAEASDALDREHVTRYVVRQPARFRHASVWPTRAEDLSSHRWTLDTADDYRLLSRVFDELRARADDASLDEVLAVFSAHPEIKRFNESVAQKGA